MPPTLGSSSRPATMEYSKWLLVQVLVVGVALAQQHPDPFQLAAQIGVRSSQFQQQQQQQRNTQNFFQQQQQQQQRPVTAFRAAPQAQNAFGSPQASGSTQVFGGGAETYMQINTRDQGASQQTRTVPAPSQPGLQQNFFQQQRVAPRPAPDQFPALTPTAFPAPAPVPVVLPNAVPAPVQQHDAQVFTRRPPPPPAPAPVPKQAQPQPQPQQFRQAPRPSQEFNANRLPAVIQDGTGFQPQPNEVQSFLPQQDSQVFQSSDDAFQQDVQRTPQVQVQVAPARQVTRTPEVRTRGPARHAAQFVDDSAPLRANPIRVAPVQVTTDDQGNLQEDDQLFREQAQNAHYTFASAVDDKLTDNSQVRQETRDGTSLKGLYSYSDGYFRRTVHYEADENGYRVTKEEVEPIGDGPMPDPTGSADVAAQFSGADYRYRITADDIKKEERQQVSAQPVFSS